MKEEQINIDEVIRNTRKYWYIDGIAEILGGVFIIIIALVYLLAFKINDPLTRSLVLGIGQPLIILAGSFFVRKLIAMIKQHITYPRTGFLSYNRQKGNHQLSKNLKRILSIVLLGVIVGAAASNLIPEYLVPILTACSIAAFSIYLGYYFAVTRFYIVAFLILLLGSLISFLPIDNSVQYPLLIGGMGWIWLCFGTLTFWSYMRNTKPMHKERS